MRPTCIDLFAGCGGMSLGLHAAGFCGIMGIEAHEHAFASYKHNLIDTGYVGAAWPDWLPIGPTNVVALSTDYAIALRRLRGTIDLVAGGPPCQGFSTNGRRDPDDPRSRMVEAYLDIVEAVRPRLVLLENVRGFVSMPHVSGVTYEQATRARLHHLGYETWGDVFTASDWGVPQRRPRYICIAAQRGSLPGINPLERLRTARRAFLAARGLDPTQTSVGAALSDLSLPASNNPDPDHGSRGFMAVKRNDGDDLTAYQRLMRAGSAGQPSDRRVARHNAVTTQRMQRILETCTPGRSISPRDRARLGIGKRSTTPLSATQPSPTVTTLPDDLIHYAQPRTMSVRELARLQSFPDWFEFQGPYTTGGDRRREGCPRYTQVGNAVPPLLAEALGETLVGLLTDYQEPHAMNERQLIDEVGSKPREVADGDGIPARPDDLPSAILSRHLQRVS